MAQDKVLSDNNSKYSLHLLIQSFQGAANQKQGSQA